jgi:YhcH/YjgK/YiaL family protein
MILDTLAAAGRYLRLSPHLAAGFDFLGQNGLEKLSVGRHEIDGDRVFAIVGRDTGKGRAGARLEIHRRYLDIQVALAGDESIGWRPLADCHEVDGPFDEARDLGFYVDRPEVWLPLPPGQFMIFFPADAHAPLAGEGPVHKVVIKVAV